MSIGPQGISVACRRLPTETVQVNANTSDGSPVVTYEAYVIPKPQISFTAASSSIPSSGSTTLNWNVANAQKVELQGAGPVQASGTITVSPAHTTDYILTVTGEDGQVVNVPVHVEVQPPPPTVTAARLMFQTTDNDKDHDTFVTVNVICGGTTIASIGSDFGGGFPDHYTSPWFGLQMVNTSWRKDQVQGVCHAMLVESPNGHDEWHFNWVCS